MNAGGSAVRAKAPPIGGRTSDVLKRARSRIQRGWTQGALRRERPFPLSLIFPPQYCALGALLVDDVQMGPALRRLNYAVSRIDRAATVESYNDAPRRKKREVLALFDRAIADAEAEEQRA